MTYIDLFVIRPAESSSLKSLSSYSALEYSYAATVTLRFFILIVLNKQAQVILETYLWF